MRKLAVVAFIVGVFASWPLFAQAFDSGSTGADGALNLATLNCDTGPFAPLPGQATGCWIQLPANGVLNYTTINVPAGKTLNFRKNLRNSPVILLAQGDVLIDGTVSVDATTWLPDNRSDPNGAGPGGFPGGSRPLSPGMGPGGGTPYDPAHPDQFIRAHWAGPLSLVPIVGGSGGGAWANGFGGFSDGAGGGGALVIASSGQITMNGIISAAGGPSCYLGDGSGGAVRLVANRINQAGQISTVQGYYCNAPSSTPPGIIRLEAPDGMLSYTGTCTPAPILSAINPAVVTSIVPTFRIVSVGGFLVPDSAGNRKDAADLVLPMQLPDPINVVVEASNIPVGSPVTVSFGTPNQGTSSSGQLAGTVANSTATLGVSGLNRTQLAYLYVQVLFTPPENGGGFSRASKSARVAKVRMTTVPGGKPQFTFLRRDGTEVLAESLPPDLQAWVSKPKSR